jgi:hypothetical protein
VVLAASGAGERDGAKRGKIEKRDFASSMGHSGKGIRVTEQLEAVGGARGRGGVNYGHSQTVGRGGRRGRQ